MSDEIKVGDVLIIKECRPDYYFKSGTKCYVYKIDPDGDIWGDFSNQGNPPDRFKGSGHWCLGKGKSIVGKNQAAIFEKVNKMSEVTLHGYPVKVGDMVWHFLRGWDTVQAIDEARYQKYPIKLSNGAWYTTDALLWQPIDQAAIESAKVKPKPVEYEWQWLYKEENGLWETTAFYHLESEMLRNCNRSHRTLFTRIEESKREVKS